MTTVLWLLISVVAGALWALAFGREPLLVAPWISLAPLVLLLQQRRASLFAFVYGLAYWLVAIHWIQPTVAVYGGLPAWLGLVVLVLLCGYLALFHLVFGALGSRIWAGSGLPAVAGTAALWVVLEWLRAHLLSGFPWNLAGYAWVELPGALALASWLGAYGVSFFVLLANAGLARALLRRRWAPWLWSVGVTLLALAWAARWSGPGEGHEGGQQAWLLQPATEVSMDWDPDRSRRDLAAVLEMSREACARAPGLLLWPESAAWPFTFELDAALRRQVVELAARGCPVLFNSVSRSGGATYNSALLVVGDGAPRRYHKRHLVPYGEYVPAPVRRLPFVGKLARNVGDFSPGADVALLPWADERLGVSICFEVIFPGEVAAAVREGATVLATLTNDGWYGDTSAPWQHFRAARFRAAENRRPLLRAALTGVSGVVEADGRVLSHLGVRERGSLSVRVAGRRGLTLYTRLPWLAPALSALVAAFAIFFCRRR